MQLLQNLVDLSETKKFLETNLKKLKDDFAESIAVKVAQLKDVEEKEDKLREQVLSYLDTENLDSVEEADKAIYKQTRKTRMIEDAKLLRDSMFENRETLEKIGVVPTEETLFRNEVVVNDKKAVTDIIEKFAMVEGRELEGILIKETRFLTIKNK